MKVLTKKQIIMLHKELIDTSGGADGLQDEGLLDSAIYTPFQTFAGQALYPTVIDRASRLAFGLIKNHPFVDGNKRIGTHAMLVFLALNGIELIYEDDDLIEIITQVASGAADEDDLHQWIEKRIL